MTDLNSLLPSGSGWNLGGATGINDSGQIVGYGIDNGQDHAFLLTPQSSGVPDGGRTLGLLATGLLGLCLFPPKVGRWKLGSGTSARLAHASLTPPELAAGSNSHRRIMKASQVVLVLAAAGQLLPAVWAADAEDERLEQGIYAALNERPSLGEGDAARRGVCRDSGSMHYRDQRRATQQPDH